MTLGQRASRSPKRTLSLGPGAGETRAGGGRSRTGCFPPHVEAPLLRPRHRTPLRVRRRPGVPELRPPPAGRGKTGCNEGDHGLRVPTKTPARHGSATARMEADGTRTRRNSPRRLQGPGRRLERKGRACAASLPDCVAPPHHRTRTPSWVAAAVPARSARTHARDPHRSPVPPHFPHPLTWVRVRGNASWSRRHHPLAVDANKCVFTALGWYVRREL